MGFSELSVSKNYEKERGEVRIDDVQNALYAVYAISKKYEALKIDEGMSIEVAGNLPLKQATQKFQFADYNSASMVLNNLELIYNDMINNSGLEYKMLISDMLDETRKLVPAAKSSDPTSINLFNP